MLFSHSGKVKIKMNNGLSFPFFFFLDQLFLIRLLFIEIYRDYEMLNYVMLKKLSEEVSNMRKNAELCWETESDVDWSTWVDTDIPDGLDNIVQDPDYMIAYEEQVGENSNEASSIGSRYNLRSRRPR